MAAKDRVLAICSRGRSTFSDLSKTAGEKRGAIHAGHVTITGQRRMVRRSSGLQSQIYYLSTALSLFARIRMGYSSWLKGEID